MEQNSNIEKRARQKISEYERINKRNRFLANAASILLAVSFIPVEHYASSIYLEALDGKEGIELSRPFDEYENQTLVILFRIFIALIVGLCTTSTALSLRFHKPMNGRIDYIENQIKQLLQEAEAAKERERLQILECRRQLEIFTIKLFGKNSLAYLLYLDQYFTDQIAEDIHVNLKNKQDADVSYIEDQWLKDCFIIFVRARLNMIKIVTANDFND